MLKLLWSCAQNSNFISSDHAATLTACTPPRGDAKEGTKLLGQTNADCTGDERLALALCWSTDRCRLLQEMWNSVTLMCKLRSSNSTLNSKLPASEGTSYRRMWRNPVRWIAVPVVELFKGHRERKMCLGIQRGKHMRKEHWKGAWKALFTSWFSTELLTGSVL